MEKNPFNPGDLVLCTSQPGSTPVDVVNAVGRVVYILSSSLQQPACEVQFPHLRETIYVFAYRLTLVPSASLVEAYKHEQRLQSGRTRQDR